MNFKDIMCSETMNSIIVFLIILSPFVSIGILIPFIRTKILGKKNKYIKYILVSYLLIIGLILLMGLFSPPFVHDTRYDQAFYNWYTNKTAETKAMLDKEADRVQKGIMIFNGVILSVLIINAFGIYCLVKYKDKKI